MVMVVSSNCWPACGKYLALSKSLYIRSDDLREMAVGNTFGATALSSYGGFWISFAIVLTPGGFGIESTLEETGGKAMFDNSFGLMLFVSLR